MLVYGQKKELINEEGIKETKLKQKPEEQASSVLSSASLLLIASSGSTDTFPSSVDVELMGILVLTGLPDGLFI